MQSMTGFARATGGHEGAAVAWEVKSVNGKGGDVRLRLPPGLERLEQQARQAVQKRFSRGNIQAVLTVERIGRATLQPVINEAFLMEVAGLARRLEEEFGTAPASADGLLALRGVLEVPEPVETEEERAAFFDEAVLACLRFTVTRITDDAIRVGKRWQRFVERREALEGMGRSGVREAFGF